MIKIKVLENYKNYKINNTYTINENEAHSLIDRGVAILYTVNITKYTDKMMRPKN
jgi:hypothetical protein